MGCSFFYKLLGAPEISLAESPILTIVPVNNENAVNEPVNITESYINSCSFFYKLLGAADFFWCPISAGQQHNYSHDNCWFPSRRLDGELLLWFVSLET